MDYPLTCARDGDTEQHYMLQCLCLCLRQRTGQRPGPVLTPTFWSQPLNSSSSRSLPDKSDPCAARYLAAIKCFPAPTPCRLRARDLTRLEPRFQREREGKKQLTNSLPLSGISPHKGLFSLSLLFVNMFFVILSLSLLKK